jgi:DtxR family Mn-dependent transcriptional regulator
MVSHTQHAQDLADHEMEHVVATLWEMDTQAETSLERLREVSRVEHFDEVIRSLDEKRLVYQAEGSVTLTPEGRELAESLVRRHRLAESLFSSVLEIGDEHAVESTACVMEHVLSPSVTDSVCSFLGHPKFCPHGKPIPAGGCCRSFSNAVEPLVQPLDKLPVGRPAKIVYIVPRDPGRLVKLSDLGLVPGVEVRLQQKRPATVLALGETTLALDRDIVSEIYVKKVE